MDTTVLIKTFERPEAVKRLIESIRKYYKHVPIVVIDDGRHEWVTGGQKCETIIQGNIEYRIVPFDIGLSAGRNLGVSLINTKYVFICDDDCIFTEATDLVQAEQLIEASDVDILGINAGVGYCGTFVAKDGTVEYQRYPCFKDEKINSLGIELYDFVPNIFLAKTESLKKYKWRDELKMGEHFAYFYDHQGKIRVGFTTKISMKHEHINAPGYDTYRARASEYVKQYMRSKGIRRRITFDGVDTI